MHASWLDICSSEAYLLKRGHMMADQTDAESCKPLMGGYLAIQEVLGMLRKAFPAKAKNYVFSVSVFTTAAMSALVLRLWPPWQFYVGSSVCETWLIKPLRQTSFREFLGVTTRTIEIYRNT